MDSPETLRQAADRLQAERRILAGIVDSIRAFAVEDAIRGPHAKQLERELNGRLAELSSQVEQLLTDSRTLRALADASAASQ